MHYDNPLYTPGGRNVSLFKLRPCDDRQQPGNQAVAGC